MAVLLALSAEEHVLEQYTQPLRSLTTLTADVAAYVHDRDTKQGKGI